MQRWIVIVVELCMVVRFGGSVIIVKENAIIVCCSTIAARYEGNANCFVFVTHSIWKLCIDTVALRVFAFAFWVAHTSMRVLARNLTKRTLCLAARSDDTFCVNRVDLIRALFQWFSALLHIEHSTETECIPYMWDFVHFVSICLLANLWHDSLSLSSDFSFRRLTFGCIDNLPISLTQYLFVLHNANVLIPNWMNQLWEIVVPQTTSRSMVIFDLRVESRLSHLLHADFSTFISIASPLR